jgi:phytanoyl-CoA hydroxylase
MAAITLHPEQRRHYDERGYLLLRGFFAPEELEVWNRRFLDIVEARVPVAREMLVMRDVMVAKGAVRVDSPLQGVAKIQDFHNDPVLFESFVRHPRLLDLVEAFLGPDLKSVHNMLINKPPGVDGRHPLHQDLLYFPFRPADAILATWVAIDRCTPENGCLVVVPGSHRGELLAHENPGWEYVNYLYVGARGVGEQTERLHLEMEPGDLVVFHPVLLHGSGRNRTPGYRRAISCHYASATCRYEEGLSPIGKGRPYLPVRGREHPGCI